MGADIELKATGVEPTQPRGSDMPGFDRCNLLGLALERGRAHDGQGDIFSRRIAVRKDLDGPCNFIDYAEIPPGCTIGLHRHGVEEEEFYLVLGGDGEMSKDGDVFRVGTGDLVRNRPGGTHGLMNVGSEVLRLFVFELSVPR